MLRCTGCKQAEEVFVDITNICPKCGHSMIEENKGMQASDLRKAYKIVKESGYICVTIGILSFCVGLVVGVLK